MSEITTAELVQAIGKNWGNNEGSEFVDFFTELAEICHPFFTKNVTPEVAVEILNSTVCGTTNFDGLRMLSGSGDGVNDTVEMHFIETGECAGYKPQYVGRMVIKAYIKNHKFTCFDVRGYDLIHANPSLHRPFRKIDIGELDSYQITEALARSWSYNDMEKFTSLFTGDNKIYHPMFKSPITAEIVADVLNSAMKGISVAHKPKIIIGDGSGKNDVIDMFFDETGNQLNYLPKTMGIMHITAKIENHRVKEFIVHGYSPAPSQFSSIESLKPAEVECVEVSMEAKSTRTTVTHKELK